ncbi:MAG TPA: D-alanyl-D-alanine carboxypeptidase [Candidatus Paceibacterota bacterium]
MMEKKSKQNKYKILGLTIALFAFRITPVLAVSETNHVNAVFVYDIRTEKTLLERNEEAQLPIASITKLVTALSALELFGREAQIEILPGALEVEGDSGLVPGEKWKVSDLVSFMLINSSNDAARALELAWGPNGKFVQAMNQGVTYMELSQTYFLNSTGLDISPTLAGAYSSARDINALMVTFNSLYPDIIIDTTLIEKEFWSDKYKHIANNTNQYTRNMLGLLGSKTGSTDLAKANLTIMFDSEIERPVIVTVLGSNIENRFSDMFSIIDDTLKLLNR